MQTDSKHNSSGFNSKGREIDSQQRDEDKEAEINRILDDMRCLTCSMKLFGMYYELSTAVKDRIKEECETRHSARKWHLTPGQLYSNIITLILWVNLIRMSTMFHPINLSGLGLFLKLASLVWMISCTLMHTNFVFSSHKGCLAAILQDLARWTLAAAQESNQRQNMKTYDVRDSCDHIVISSESEEGFGVEGGPTREGGVGFESRSMKEGVPTGKMDSDFEHGHSGCRGSKFSDDDVTVDKSDVTMVAIYSATTRRRKTTTKHQLTSKEIGSKLKLKSPREILKSRAKFYAATAWAIILVNIIFSSYLLFATETLEVALSPFGTYVIVENMLPLRMLYLVLHTYMSAGWALPPAMTFFVWMTIREEFTRHNRSLERCLRDDGDCASRRGAQVEDGTVERHRVHHDKLTQLADVADKATCWCVGIMVVGHIGIVILGLYNILFNSDVTDPLSIVSNLFWILTAAGNLCIVSAFGMLVNSAAHEASSSLHSLDLQNADLKTTVQVSVFLSRLYGEAIGFSVLRIFVVDRTTILTIIGMLVTYFLLIIQFSPPSFDKYNSANLTTASPEL